MAQSNPTISNLFLVTSHPNALAPRSATTKLQRATAALTALQAKAQVNVKMPQHTKITITAPENAIVGKEFHIEANWVSTLEHKEGMTAVLKLMEYIDQSINAPSSSDTPGSVASVASEDTIATNEIQNSDEFKDVDSMVTRGDLSDFSKAKKIDGIEGKEGGSQGKFGFDISVTLPGCYLIVICVFALGAAKEEGGPWFSESGGLFEVLNTTAGAGDGMNWSPARF